VFSLVSQAQEWVLWFVCLRSS